MATTYTLISSNVLTGSAASVTFSSIPSTYTDLVLRVSARSDRAGVNTDALLINFNSDNGTNYSNTILLGMGSSGTISLRYSTAARIYTPYINGDSSTSNTFTNVELYLPNYLASTSKPSSIFMAQENNNTEAFITAGANLYASAAAISSITLAPNVGPNFVSGSSFYLYGIKNS